MRTLAYALVTATILVAPLTSFAQSQSSSQPLTRAEVKAQLAQLEQAGYNPSATNDATYPVEIQAAERRVAAEQEAAQPGTTSYGSGMNGSAQSSAQTLPAAGAPAN